jgi:hypothetical protein
VFNFVANYACLKYSYMIEDIQAVQHELEGNFLALQPSVEKTAVEIAEADPGLLTEYLTSYSVSAGERVTARWTELAEHLLTKYNDGYVRDENEAQQVGYPEEWLRDVIRLRPDQFYLEEAPADTAEEALPY